MTPQEAAPVAVDDVGAGLVPHMLEDLESSFDLVLLLFISTLQEALCRRQNHLHLHVAIVLRLMDPLQTQGEDSQSGTLHMKCVTVWLNCSNWTLMLHLSHSSPPK